MSFIEQDPVSAAGVTDHDDLTNVTIDQHHPKSHTHDGADGSGTVSHGNLSNLTTGDPHTQYTENAGS